jgi:hypothetical protein
MMQTNHPFMMMKGLGTVSLYSEGALSAGAWPSSHLEVQKFAMCGHSIWWCLCMHWRGLWCVWSQGTWVPAQGRFWSVHSNHFHRRGSTRLNVSRSRNPSPPGRLGRQTTFQLMRQIPRPPFDLNSIEILSNIFQSSESLTYPYGKLRTCRTGWLIRVM